MNTFFHYHSKLAPFRAFSGEHLVTLALIFVLCMFLFVFEKKVKEKQPFFRYSLALLLLASEGSYHIWLIFTHAWSAKKALPLHLSDLAVILAIVMLLTKSDRVFQFMYFAGLASSIQAILTPDLYKYSFPHFRSIQFFVSHGGVILACLLMVAALDRRPTSRAMWVTILFVNLYAACVFFVNTLLGSNYLYIMEKPRMSSLLNYLGPWPGYLLSLEAVMVLSFSILYSPFWIKRKR